MDWRIEKRDAFEVVVKAKQVKMEDGKPNPIPVFWGEFFSAGLHRTITPALGVCGEVHSGTEEFPYGIGDFRKERQEVPAGFEVWKAPACEWAVFKCVGPMPDAIVDMWEKIHGEWTPNAEWEHERGIIDFELYLDGDTSSADYVSEIWLPVKKRMMK